MPADRTSEARRLLWRWVGLVVCTLALGGMAVFTYLRYRAPAAQDELLWYFRDPFPVFHARTRSLQSALAGLVEEPLPSPETALGLLDDNILPSMDELIAALQALGVHELDTKMLHAGYLRAVLAMRTDAVALRALFADPTLDVAEKRRRTRERLAGVPRHFDRFYERTVDIWQANDIKAAPPRR